MVEFVDNIIVINKIIEYLEWVEYNSRYKGYIERFIMVLILKVYNLMGEREWFYNN